MSRLMIIEIASSHQPSAQAVKEIVDLRLQKQYLLDVPHQVVLPHVHSFTDLVQASSFAMVVFQYSAEFSHSTACNEGLLDTQGLITDMVKRIFEVDKVFYRTEVLDLALAERSVIRV